MKGYEKCFFSTIGINKNNYYGLCHWQIINHYFNLRIALAYKKSNYFSSYKLLIINFLFQFMQKGQYYLHN